MFNNYSTVVISAILGQTGIPVFVCDVYELNAAVTNTQAISEGLSGLLITLKAHTGCALTVVRDRSRKREVVVGMYPCYVSNLATCAEHANNQVSSAGLDIEKPRLRASRENGPACHLGVELMATRSGSVC